MTAHSVHSAIGTNGKTNTHHINSGTHSSFDVLIRVTRKQLALSSLSKSIVLRTLQKITYNSTCNCRVHPLKHSKGLKRGICGSNLHFLMFWQHNPIWDLCVPPSINIRIKLALSPSLSHPPPHTHINTHNTGRSYWQPQTASLKTSGLRCCKSKTLPYSPHLPQKI